MLEDDAPPQKPRVCIDGRLDAATATGVARYARGMRAALTAVGRAPLTLDDAAAGRFGAHSTWSATIARRARAIVPAPVTLRAQADRLTARDIFRLAQVRFAVTGRLLTLRAPGRGGIMHWTYPIPARIDGWVNCYTVHDVIPLTDPALSPIAPGAMRRRLVAIAAAADRIVTVSAHARSAIVDTLALDPGAVTNCGAALCELAPSAALPAGLRPAGYYLFCGLAEPRKNLPRLIDAWSRSETERPLVLAGPDMASVAPRPGLIVLPYQDRADLAALLAGARALLFPSLAEGFGLPIVEAMALGTPVLTAAGGATAETAGGAALLVDPTDTDAIAAGIAALDRDDPLCASLAARGLARAHAFTPAAFGERLARLHDEFAGDSRLLG